MRLTKAPYIPFARPMTGSAKQSILPQKESLDCFVAALLEMTVCVAGGMEEGSQ